MSGKKCKHCGSSDIEVDPSRGDAVCTSCGTVLEDNIIVAEIEFQETAHGGASAIGQFVSSESKGGASGFGRAFNAGVGVESREITLRKARNGITNLCQQLRLNQQCIDISCNFFKMALLRHLTIGRPAHLTQAACVYITCRTEGTAHLLIDISDAQQICCYQLGRAYYRLARALSISIPPTDPCLYILRFSSQLHFKEKQHEVTMTALRLVQRMKRDSIHSGRRPSGVCGAALLIAARLHDFSRTPNDVVRIVKVHETTIRKRLFEFGETPSSELTLEEFMNVDLEEEQDPPAFKAARKKDKERLAKLMEEEDGETELTELQREIDAQMERDSIKRRKVASTPVALPDASAAEEEDATKFAAQDTLDVIGQAAKEDASLPDTKKKGLGPDLDVIGLGSHMKKLGEDSFLKPDPKTLQYSKDLHDDDELILSKEDEKYVSYMIMTEDETTYKTRQWDGANGDYMKELKLRQEMRARDLEEKKDKKKKVRGSYKKKATYNAATAGQAIEMMLAEKKISSKINYDILKKLVEPGAAAPAPSPAPAPASAPASAPPASDPGPAPASAPGPAPISNLTDTVTDAPTMPNTPKAVKTPVIATTLTRKRKSIIRNPGQIPILEESLASPTPARQATPAPAKRATPTPAKKTTPKLISPAPSLPVVIDLDDYDDDMDADAGDAGEELSLAAMLHNGPEEDYYDYEEY